MSAVCLHTRALRAIENRLDALLQAREGYTRSISGDAAQQHFRVEATDDCTAACAKFNSETYFECKSSVTAIQAFFERLRKNDEYNELNWRTKPHKFLNYAFYERFDDQATIQLKICGEGGETLEFTKPVGAWINIGNRPVF
jgi:hypothetical protein